MRKPSRDLPPHNTVWIDVEDFEFVCFRFAKELLTFNEPIPDYNTRDNALLESALSSPRHTFDGKDLYHGLEEKSSVLFYSMVKNHAFVNGNKRIAVTTLLVFLALNGKWIKIMPKDLYDLAIITSKSDAKDRDVVLKENTKIIKKFIVDMPFKLP